MTLNLDFTPEQLRGITSARLAYNSGLQPSPDGVSSLDIKSTDEEYLTFVILSASDSYAKQYPV